MFVSNQAYDSLFSFFWCDPWEKKSLSMVHLFTKLGFGILKNQKVQIDFDMN